MAHSIDPQRVVDVLRASPGQGLHVAELSAQLGVPVKKRRALRRVLDDLAKEGSIQSLPGARYRVAREKVDATPARHETRVLGKNAGRPRSAALDALVTGEFRANPRGFGFVVPADGGDDLFVPETAVDGAMHLDRVAVERTAGGGGAPRRRGATLGEARVVRIVERTLRRIAGTLRRSPQGAWLVPDDERVRGPIRLAEAGVARDGLAVVAEITRYPDQVGETPEGKLLEVLGEPGVASVETAKILLSNAVPTEFSADVVAEAEAARAPDAVPAAGLAGRRDVRDLPLCTVDPADARDHDDAVYVERVPEGFRAVVAIADVSQYVRPGTALDREAQDRGCSVYLPDRVVPMLPEKLSANLCSLVPDVDRLCMTAEVVVSHAGEVVSAKFAEAVMRSRAKLSYGTLAATLGLSRSGEDKVAADPRAESLRAGLEVMRDLARLLRERRMARGSLDFALTEARVRIDPKTGAVVDVYRSPTDPGEKQAYSIIEELMLLANESVAHEFSRRGVAVVYRVHGRPDEEKLAVFGELARQFGFSLSVDEGLTPLALSAFLRRVAGKPAEKALNQLLLRAMKQAVYDPVNVGHFGLAAREYLHFTSPIRRYPDLLVHRALRALLRGEAVDPSRYAEQAAHASARERRAMEVERDTVGLYRTLLMRAHVGDDYEGTVSAVTPQGLFVELDAPYVDGLVPIERIGEDFFDFRETEMRIVGRRSGRAFALGDRLRVRIEDVSVTRRRIELRIVDGSGSGRGKGRGKATHVVVPRSKRRRGR